MQLQMELKILCLRRYCLHIGQQVFIYQFFSLPLLFYFTVSSYFCGVFVILYDNCHVVVISGIKQRKRKKKENRSSKSHEKLPSPIGDAQVKKMPIIHTIK